MAWDLQRQTAGIVVRNSASFPYMQQHTYSIFVRAFILASFISHFYYAPLEGKKSTKICELFVNYGKAVLMGESAALVYNLQRTR